MTGRLSAVTYATVPRVQDAIANAGYKMFPDSKPKSPGEGDASAEQGEGSAEQKAFARATRGTHW